jgi:hypothetical protein
MSAQGDPHAARLGFLDNLGRLFAHKDEPAPESRPEQGIEALDAAFEEAVRKLGEKVEAQRSTRAGPGPAAEKPTPEARAAERAKRIEAAHRAMREDIEKMHASLGTGLAGPDLDAICSVLEGLADVVAEGRESHGLLPRARFAIAERLRREAGELAVARIAGLLDAHGMHWPDASHARPSATPVEIESARARRMADLRRVFLADDFARIADSLRGIVKGWGSDYPDRGTPVWEACALEGVAAGIRGGLVRDFVEVLRKDRDELLRRTEDAVGKEVRALQAAVAGGVRSLDQANQVVASTREVIDEVVPSIAWEQVCNRIPAARGETAAGPARPAGGG